MPGSWNGDGRAGGEKEVETVAEENPAEGIEEAPRPRRIPIRVSWRWKRVLFLVLACAALAAAALFPSSCTAREVTPQGEVDGTLENDFSFLVCGDPNGRTDLLQRVVEQAGEGEFLVIVGDITTSGEAGELEEMKNFLDSTGLRYFLIPGDNDMPQGDPSMFRSVFGPDYYSVDVQNAHLVFLDNAVRGAGCPPEELAWLREDLGSTTGRPVIAFAHVPPGAPLEMPGEEYAEEEVRNNREMRDLLAEHGCAVLYCGHIHAYLLYSSGPPRVVVTGGAGAKPHLSESAGGYYHFLRVTVEGEEVVEEVIRL